MSYRVVPVILIDELIDNINLGNVAKKFLERMMFRFTGAHLLSLGLDVLNQFCLMNSVS